MTNDVSVSDEHDDGDYDDSAPDATERWVVVTREQSGHHRGSRPMSHDSAERLRDELAGTGNYAGVTIQRYNVDAPVDVRATETR